MEKIELLKKVIETDMKLTFDAARNMDNPKLKKQLMTEAATLKNVLMMIEDENHLHEIAKVFGIE